MRKPPFGYLSSRPVALPPFARSLLGGHFISRYGSWLLKFFVFEPGRILVYLSRIRHLFWFGWLLSITTKVYHHRYTSQAPHATLDFTNLFGKLATDMRNIVRVNPALETEVRNKIEETLAIARVKYPNAKFTTPTLVFRQMGRRAGLCSTNRITKACTVSINPDFFANHHDQMINRTVPHEVAHYISLVVYGQEGSGHGYLWQSVMRALGIADSTRCHTYSLEGVKTRQVSKPYAYKCGCRVHNETAYIHNKIQRGYKYTCNRCRQKLVYFGINQPYSFQVNPPAPIRPPAVVPPTPEKPLVVQPALPPEPKYRLVTRFVNGSLVNEHILA